MSTSEVRGENGLRRDLQMRERGHYCGRCYDETVAQVLPYNVVIVKRVCDIQISYILWHRNSQFCLPTGNVIQYYRVDSCRRSLLPGSAPIAVSYLIIAPLFLFLLAGSSSCYVIGGIPAWI